MKNPLVELMDEASRALPYSTKSRGMDADPLYIKKKAASLRTLVLNKTALPKLDENGQLVSAPHANIAGQSVPCSVAIANGSRVAEAGASLIFLPEHFGPQFVEQGRVAMKMHPDFPRHFVNVDAAQFAEIPDDQDVPTTPRPIHLGPITLDGLRQYSVRMEVNHKEQVTRGGEQVANEILAGIVAGISRTVDAVYLGTVLAANPEAFSVAKAAAKGAKVESLRALVGTTGAGAGWRGDGKFAVAGGIAAELTAATASTVVGWFERGAVVLGPDLSILAERLNVNGDLTVTAWFSLEAVIPDPAQFWTVSA